MVDPGKAPPNTFGAQNLLIYESGLVGPRPGFKEIPTTGLPTATVVPGPVGFDCSDEDLVVVVGDSPYRVPLDTVGSAIQMGSYLDPATSFVQFAEADRNLYSISNGKLYKHVANSTTPVTLPPNVLLGTLIRWNYYLIGHDINVPYRLYFSKVTEAGPEFDVWDANAYVDVGSNMPVTSLIAMFNQLMVGKEDGWWSVAGVLADRPSVRGVEVGNGPVDRRQIAMTTDNRALYWATEKAPHWFNGSGAWIDEPFRVSGYDTGYPCHSVIATPTGRRLLMLGSSGDPNDEDTLLIQREKQWSAHQVAKKLAGFAPSDVRNGYHLPPGVIFGVAETNQIGEDVKILSFAHDLERPAHADDTWASPIDYEDTNLVTGSLVTPAWYDSQGRSVMVRNIQIQFRKWASGITDSVNEMQVKVRPLARWQAGSINTKPQIWVEPSSRADKDGTDDSWSLSFGAQGYSTGFQIEILNIRGIAIREINVGCEVVTRRG